MDSVYAPHKVDLHSIKGDLLDFPTYLIIFILYEQIVSPLCMKPQSWLFPKAK